MADWSHPPEVRFDELVQPARIELPLLDPEFGRDLGIISTNLLDDALASLAPHEHLELDAVGA